MTIEADEAHAALRERIAVLERDLADIDRGVHPTYMTREMWNRFVEEKENLEARIVELEEEKRQLAFLLDKRRKGE